MAKVLSSKLVLLGDSGVGKSNIVLRLVKDQFSEGKEPTIGATFLTHEIVLNDLTKVRLAIWDTAGQERFHSLGPIYYRDAETAVIVYDITNSQTFERAQSWVLELKRQVDRDIILVLIGNKLDLENERQVSMRDGKQFADEKGMFFCEASAKTDTNIKELFKDIAEQVAKLNGRTTTVPDYIKKNDKVNIDKPYNNNKQESKDKEKHKDKDSCCL